MPTILYETHSHTPLCKHAKGEPEAYAAAAEAAGLRGILITCHNPMPDQFSAHVRMDPDEFPTYLEMVARTREAWEGRVDVRLGIEADYFAGYESWLEQQLASADFHYVLGSVHPQISEFKARYGNVEPIELQRTYFRLLADAAETGLFDCISHPDLIKNETPHDWRPEMIMDDIRTALDRIKASGTAMELNTSGAKKVIQEMNPFPDMLREMAIREIPVVIGADAHIPQRVGDRFTDALKLLQACGHRTVSFFLERKRETVEIDQALESLATHSAS